MKFALVNGLKTEPQPGLKGICDGCQSETIAKCGEKKLWHWAHKNRVSCDPWWENETEWHRRWKNNFPVEWQEITHVDEHTKEKHIADVKTKDGLIIEFQHSSIKPEEVRSREGFYKEMVWVADGARLKRDYPRFSRNFLRFKKLADGVFLTQFPEEHLASAWLTSSVPVYFDFQDAEYIEPEGSDYRMYLWCFLPSRIEGYATLLGVSHAQFIELAQNQPHLLFGEKYLSKVTNYFAMKREQSRRNELALLSQIRGFGKQRRTSRF